MFVATMFDPFVKCHAKRADRDLDLGDIVGERNLYEDIFDMVRRNLTICVPYGMFLHSVACRSFVCSQHVWHDGYIWVED